MRERLFEEVSTYLGEDYLPEQEDILQILVNRGINLFKSRRNYPKNFTQEQISEDMEQYYSCIFDLIVFSFEKQGAENESSHIENNVHRVYESENSIFIKHGVYPYLKTI